MTILFRYLPWISLLAGLLCMTPQTSLAQHQTNEHPKDTLQWKNIRLVTMTKSNLNNPSHCCAEGEALLKKRISSVENIGKTEMRKIRRKTGKKRQYLVTLDTALLFPELQGTFYVWYIDKN